ncbi:hypothetical protein [Buttiauxella massiliensis]|uniref:hypothetical protein n=1 Tax=Buttiauxella massiliensis TaxID=2831590 RepID=UPI00125EEB01|nr:hypothetical protein [Buttiauxella massiliensis]
MAASKEINSAIEKLTSFRNTASEMADVNLTLIEKLLNGFTEVSKGSGNINDYYMSFSSDLSKSIDALQEYNKSIEDYIEAMKLLSSIKDGNNNGY